jgi:ADP-heptose:LPS heptosyltransferase
MKYAFRSPLKRAAAAALDGAGRLAVAPFLRRPASTDWSRTLVMRLDHLGDVLLATGVPEAVKRHAPQAKVSFLCGSWAAPLLENNPFVDEVLEYDAPWFAAGRYERRAKGFRATLGELRRRRFTAALSLRGDAREHLLAYLAGVPERVGPGITGLGFLLTREAAVDPNAHESSRNAAVLSSLGVDARGLAPRIFFSTAEEASWPDLAARWRVDGARPLVGILAGAGSPAKNWPRTAEFAALLRARRPECRIVWIGGPGAAAPAQADDADLRGRTTLRELCLLLRHMAAFVGPDSGPTHLAGALGVRTVFIYSATNDFGRWRPLYANARALRMETGASAEEALAALDGNGQPLGRNE